MGSYYYHNYGSAGAATAVCAGIANLLASQAKCNGGSDLEGINYLLIVVGIVLFTLSFFNLVGHFREILPIFYLAIIGLAVTSVCAVYGAFLSFHCGGYNVFKSRDGYSIAIFVLDILAAIFIISATLGFARWR